MERELTEVSVKGEAAGEWWAQASGYLWCELVAVNDIHRTAVGCMVGSSASPCFNLHSLQAHLVSS